MRTTTTGAWGPDNLVMMQQQQQQLGFGLPQWCVVCWEFPSGGCRFKERP